MLVKIKYLLSKDREHNQIRVYAGRGMGTWRFKIDIRNYPVYVLTPLTPTLESQTSLDISMESILLTHAVQYLLRYGNKII